MFVKSNKIGAINQTRQLEEALKITVYRAVQSNIDSSIKQAVAVTISMDDQRDVTDARIRIAKEPIGIAIEKHPTGCNIQ